MKKTKLGFTIIEVSLVLVIGGLIFMMVFFALPSMRRQQKDTERKDDVMLLAESIKKFQTNNRGALPGVVGAQQGMAGWIDFVKKYIDENYMSTTSNIHKTFVDPDGEEYHLEVQSCTNVAVCKTYDQAASSVDYTMHVFTQATCNDTDQVVKGINNPRNFAVLYKTESNGVYCQSS